MIQKGSEGIDYLEDLEYGNYNYGTQRFYLIIVWLLAFFQFTFGLEGRTCRKAFRRTKFWRRYTPGDRYLCFRCEKLAGERFITALCWRFDFEESDPNINEGKKPLIFLKFVAFITFGVLSFLPFVAFIDEFPFASAK